MAQAPLTREIGKEITGFRALQSTLTTNIKSTCPAHILPHMYDHKQKYWQSLHSYILEHPLYLTQKGVKHARLK